MNRLASIGINGTVRVWNIDDGVHLSSGENVSIVPEPPSTRSILCSSTDGNCLAACRGRIIYIWNLNENDSLDVIRTINVGNKSIRSLCMNSDGKRILSGQQNGLSYWNIESGELMWSCSTQSDQGMYAVDISYDGTLVASSDLNGTVRLYSAEIGEEICQFIGHFNDIRSVRFNPGVSKIASGSNDGIIRIWDIASRTQVMKLEGHVHFLTDISYSYDGNRLASASCDKTVMVWDMNSGECLFVLKGHTRFVFSVSFSSDGSRIASGGDTQIIIWDSVSGSEIMRLNNYDVPVAVVQCLPSVSDYMLK